MTTSDIAGAAPAPTADAGADAGAALRPGPGGGGARAGAPDPRAPLPGGVAPRAQDAPAAPRAEAAPRARSAEALPAAPPQTVRRRGGGDPVKALLHRHRELCERAVDPLEIAAGLEAHGISDRTAARFRHRDVFSLAEELYARTPRGDAPADPARRPARTGPRAARGFGYALLPGALACAAAATGMPGAGPLAALVTAGALVWPGRSAGGRLPWAAHLLAAAVVGWAVHRYGPALGAALALAVAPAHLAAALYAARARRRLTRSRALEDFAAGARPLLAGVLLLFAAAATGAAAVTGAAPAVAVPLAVLLFLVRLLLRHGPHRLPVALALALALIPLPAAVSAAAAGLLVHAVLALSRASAHARP